jgi:hypothetical protein
MSKHRNPYAQAHSLRGGAGSGTHKDHRQEIIDRFTDPYSPEWMDLCPKGGDLPTDPCRARVDNDVKTIPSGTACGQPPAGPPPLSRDFLLRRGYCCDMGCTNCPFPLAKDPP